MLLNNSPSFKLKSIYNILFYSYVAFLCYFVLKNWSSTLTKLLRLVISINNYFLL